MIVLDMTFSLPFSNVYTHIVTYYSQVLNILILFYNCNLITMVFIYSLIKHTSKNKLMNDSHFSKKYTKVYHFHITIPHTMNMLSAACLHLINNFLHKLNLRTLFSSCVFNT